ncbi:MAG: NACHT domain-containing protein [Candidatus Solibacter usitatus]|nr:NACHT domain-containing protein [Candidatus Solibacter usitatus]
MSGAFPDFFGNSATAAALDNMVRQNRIPQTLLFVGAEGIGKATLARRFAAALLGGADKIELDDLSLPANLELLAEREKLPSDKRADDPLLLASHPDFITLPPDGPLRQISIQQTRLLKERSAFSPSKGQHRIFLIDRIDRANEQAANSLLKLLEEPPAHLILILTAENDYDLLPTIRSRSVSFSMHTLSAADMQAFAKTRGMNAQDRRIPLAGGSPGVAASMDLEIWDKRRERMLALLETAAHQSKFSDWIGHSEKISASRGEKLEFYLKPLYGLLEDILLLREGLDARNNPDLSPRLRRIAANSTFEWLRAAAARTDELVEFSRRNVQKGIALDAFAAGLVE